MNNFRILLDPGHGAGKTYNRGGVCFNEGDNNFYYALILKKELEKLDNVIVDMTRNKITDNPSLATRRKMAKGYDLFISLHSNAFDKIVRGSEIFDSVERPNKKLATELVKVISEDFKHHNRGVKYKEGKKGYNWYGVLRFNDADTAMIIEHGFHTNKLDCSHFKNNHTSIARKTVKVIANHHNLRFKKTTPIIPTEGGKTLHRVQLGAFEDRGNAEKLVQELKKKGYEDAFIRTEGKVVKSNRSIKVASRVKVKLNARSYEGKKIASFIYKNTYTVDQLKNNRAVLDLKGIRTAFHVDDLKLQ